MAATATEPVIARATLTVDLQAIAANWRALDARSGAGVETAAVVKADAYGLGVDRVAPVLAAAGVRCFCVAIAEEGAELRRILGPGPEILVFSGLMPGDAGVVREADLAPCLNTPAQVAAFLELLPGHACALQIDTGMNRLGLEPAELAAIAGHLPRLAPRRVFSHLACADEPGHPMNAAQRAAFEAALATVPGVPCGIAATGGILIGPAFHYDFTRPGIGLYGGLPFAEARPVVTLSLPVIQVRELARGETVGYGATWRAPRPSRIATVDAGYADGIHRAISGRGVRLYGGATPCRVVGRVSMDLVTADVTELDEVPESLELLNAHQTIDDLARAAGTIGYEILTSLGARYRRVYNGPLPSDGRP